MRGYTSSSYGDAFADVYDEWYPDVSDVAATVAAVRDLAHEGRAPGGRVLELGVGTGRLAIPFAAAGLQVCGVDTSEAMLSRLAAKDPGGTVALVRGDMVDDMPEGPFDVVVVAYNTLFGLLTEERQRACFRAVASRLSAEGCFVVEAFVPSPQGASAVAVRSLAVDRVVISVSVSDVAEQRAEGHYVEITESAGVRLRPWSIRYATPAQLDEMAAAAGFTLRERWGDFDRGPFSGESDRHVSLYELSRKSVNRV